MTLTQYLRLIVKLWRARKRPFFIVYDYQCDDTQWTGQYQYYANHKQMRHMASFIDQTADDIYGQDNTLNEARRLLRP